MQAIILAGGLGTRLKTVVSDVPKSMAPVCGRPFLEYLLDHCIDQEIRHFILSVGYKRKIIEDHFGFCYKNASIDYAVEDAPLGTGGGVLNAIKKLNGRETVIVLNGDTFVKFDLKYFFQCHKFGLSNISILLRSVSDCSRYGEAILTGDIISEFRYPGFPHVGLINAGVYLIEPDFFDGYKLPESFSFEKDFLYKYLDKIKPLGVISNDYFVDIGIPEDYKQFCEDRLIK